MLTPIPTHITNSVWQMSSIDQYLAGKILEREKAGNLRSLSVNDGIVDFFSNDYLGFVTTGLLSDMLLQEPPDSLKTGATGSRLLSGNNQQFENLEEAIAKFHHAEAALLFNSGYNANIGLLSSVISRDTIVISDELCHASIIDGIRLGLSQKKFKFAHNNLADLEEKIIRNKSGGPLLVVVESVYSMDGDFAPLVAIAEMCKNHNAQLIVDEAHATGVFGDKGQGLVCALGIEESVFARVHTYGKALGAHGASVVGSKLLKQFLINFSRSFIYTTALPGHTVASIDCAYQHLSSDRFSNKPLHALIAYFRNKIKESGNANWMDSHSTIQALLTGDNNKSRLVANTLLQAGIQAKAILHPTVPLGRERLRICLHTYNTTPEIDLLFNLLNSTC